MKCILMDVEGTTTSISFVHDTLFPYAYEKIDSFVAQNPDIVSELKDPARTLKEWIKEDKKEPLLKKIQGLIWQKGYESGELKGHIYPDVPKAFERWKKKNLTLAIYSSGSVLAQKLIFKYSDFGDLDQYISHNFDTKVGHKREVDSYKKIVKQLGFEASEILFLSDIAEELEAAKDAGMQVKQLCRGGEVESRFERVADFNLI